MDLPAILLEVSGLLMVAVLVGLLARRVHVPLTVVLVVVGLVASLVGLPLHLGELEGESFEQVVVFLFLPVLVFAAALDIDLRSFAKNLGPILALAIPAFLLSAVLVGGALHILLGTALAVAFPVRRAHLRDGPGGRGGHLSRARGAATAADPRRGREPAQ